MTSHIRPISVAVEGYLDEVVVRRICKEIEIEIGTVYPQKGKHRLDSKLAGFNNAARFWPWLVLRDMDTDADCAPELLDKLLPNRAPLMYFRVVVHQIEAWLLGDRNHVAEFLNIASSRVPAVPESLTNPKATLLLLAKASRSRAIREGLVPREGSGAVQGPEYAVLLGDFALRRWDLYKAADRCPSLAHCIKRLQLAKRQS